ncbi:MAG: hypothetical protein KC418_04350 [Anaerolineales bacterium]|nr:hypothetical protein [Anaerolineales bacterium]MCB8952745.1 hypothetical protein [Ardenticatenales bacterium]
MKTQVKWLVLLSIMATMMMALPVLAKDQIQDSGVQVNETTVIRPDVGMAYEGGIVGENGYKVFNPGAIAIAPIISTEEEAGILATRTGSTDAWLAWSWSFDWKKFGWDHLSAHNSHSDLWEDEIWADGRLKITTDGSWRTTCSQHTAGYNAVCTNNFFQLLPRTIYAETDHHFRKSGYVDSNFSTNDSA